MATEFNNIDFGFRYGTQRAIDSTRYLQGTFNIATDTGELYIDIGGSRISMNKDIHLINTEAELRAIADPTSYGVYYTKDTMRLFVYNEIELRWVNIGGSPDEINARIDNLIQVVDSLHSFELVILESVDDLPEVGESNVVYFIPQNLTPDTDTKYDEFVWIASLGYYEKIGITEADLGSYYKKSDVDSIIGENYVVDPTAVNYKGTVSSRLNTTENKITTLETEMGVIDTSSAGFVPVSDRLTEVEAKIGSTMDSSDTTGFKTIDVRLDTLEAASSSYGTDIPEIKAKLGAYPNSDAVGFVTIQNRFNEIEAKIGSTMDSSDTTGFKTIDVRLDTLEDAAATAANDIAEFKLQLGNYPHSYNIGFVTIENRFQSVENEIISKGEDITNLSTSINNLESDIESKIGTMDPTDTGFKTINERLNALESTGAAAADVADIANKIGNYPDPSEPGFVTIYEKLMEIENKLSIVESYAMSVANPLHVPESIEPESDPEEP